MRPGASPLELSHSEKIFSPTLKIETYQVVKQKHFAEKCLNKTLKNVKKCFVLIKANISKYFLSSVLPKTQKTHISCFPNTFCLKTFFKNT